MLIKVHTICGGLLVFCQYESYCDFHAHDQYTVVVIFRPKVWIGCLVEDTKFLS